MSKLGGTPVLPGLDQSDWETLIDGLDDNQLGILASSAYMNVPAHSSPVRENDQRVDEDGFEQLKVEIDMLKDFGKLQRKCWQMFNSNPQINSHVRDVMGMLTGADFEVTCDVPDIAAVLDLVTDDIRNELIKMYGKWAARAEIEGELFLALTVHPDGFVEIDFMEPTALTGKGDDGSGIYFHPRKATLPILYSFKVKNDLGQEQEVLVPSIYAAYYPGFIKDVEKANKFNAKELGFVATINKKYKKIGGFKSFIVAWDKGFLTKRNVSHIKTTLEWVNHYVNLKKWEIDHKKSSGSYLWVVEMEDMKAFRTWLKMTPEQRAETGLAAKKVPGGTLVCPPGVKVTCQNPKLATISEQDTDIMHMVTSGLNKPEDMVTGQTKGDTFSGIKASRGPQADRTKDEIMYWERFLRNDFWRSVFFLHSVMNKDFKLKYKFKQTVEFKNKKGKQKFIELDAHKLIDFTFPTSEISDLESKAKALLGVNHQSVVESLGIPRRLVARKLGFSNYPLLRYEYADEEEHYPELPITAAILLGASQKETGEANLNKANTTKKAGDDGKTGDDEGAQKKSSGDQQAKPTQE